MSRFEPTAPRFPGDPRRPLPDGLAIRAAGPPDVTSIAALAHARDGGEVGTHSAGLERDLAAIDAGAERALWVATSRGTVLAFARAARFVREPDAPSSTAPSGWYLTGLVVAPEHRRRGIGEALTIERIRLLAERTDVIRYFANSRNLATIALHDRLGFVEVTRRFTYPGVVFDGGEGVLFERRITDSDLRSSPLPATLPPPTR